MGMVSDSHVDKFGTSHFSTIQNDYCIVMQRPRDRINEKNEGFAGAMSMDGESRSILR